MLNKKKNNKNSHPHHVVDAQENKAVVARNKEEVVVKCKEDPHAVDVPVNKEVAVKNV